QGIGTDHHPPGIAALRADADATADVTFVLRAAIDPRRSPAAAARDDAVDGQRRLALDRLLVEDVELPLPIELLPSLGG
ncbi:MAG TPA: hypothetical protein DCY47_02450, partial [Candidatus Accumulibacter sp.]|nr:hypothetical protein [Accumulibacter sp.]